MNFKTNIFRAAQLPVVVGLLLCCINPSAAQQMGKVQISSLNLKDEIVPFINIVIKGNGIRRELATVGTGDEYENGGLVELPVGVYRVTSRKGNYFDFRRSKFRVRPGAVTRINVYPLIRVRTQMLMSDGSDRYVFARRPSYDVYDIPHSADKAINLFVRYDKKRGRGEYVDYGVANHGDGNVMVSYDALSLYADRVRLDRKNFTLTAQGNVTLEDGTQRIKANNVTVRFNNGAPEIAASTPPAYSGGSVHLHRILNLRAGTSCVLERRRIRRIAAVPHT